MEYNQQITNGNYDMCVPMSVATPTAENVTSTAQVGSHTALTSGPQVMTSSVVNFMLLRDMLGVDQGSTSMHALTEQKSSDDDYNHIFAVAQANLVAQTQQDIALQLVEQSQGQFSGLGKGSQEQHNQSFSMCSNHLITDNLNKSPNAEKKSCPLQLVKKPSSSRQEHNEKQTLASHHTKSLKDPDVVTIPTKKLMKVEKLQCGIEGCDRSFVYKAHLKYHKLTHSNDRRFHCEVEGCGQSFFTAQRLKVHSHIHNGTRPFVCEECNRGFTTAGNLKNHKRTHSGERPYLCTYEGCKKSFAENSTLQKHLRTHTGEKPFKCMICTKAFSQSSSRSQHMKKHLIEEKDKWLTESQVTVSSSDVGVIKDPEGSNNEDPRQSELPLGGVLSDDSPQTPSSSCRLDLIHGETTLMTFVQNDETLNLGSAEKQIIIVQDTGQQASPYPCNEEMNQKDHVYVIKDVYQH